MSLSIIIFLWLEWHFVDVPKKILMVWFNILKFNLAYFSVPVLLKTLFDHWHRYKMPYSRRFELWPLFETFTFNMMSRFVGALLRIIFILSGIVLEIFIFVAGLFVLIFWFVLPLVILISFLTGIKIVLW